MKVYLDNCSLQRPLDRQTQVRIALEAEAILGLLALCTAGKLELVSSEALLFETAKCPDETRREYAAVTLSLARVFVAISESLVARARALGTLGIKPMDALHLASAEDAHADYFCTSDDQLLKRARAVADLRTRAVSPLELIRELESW